MTYDTIPPDPKKRWVYRGTPLKKLPKFDIGSLSATDRRSYFDPRGFYGRPLLAVQDFPYCCAMKVITHNPGNMRGRKVDSKTKPRLLHMMQHLLNELVSPDEAYTGMDSDDFYEEDAATANEELDGIRTSYVMVVLNASEMASGWHALIEEYFGFRRLEDDFMNKWHGLDSAIGIWGLNLGRYQDENM